MLRRTANRAARLSAVAVLTVGGVAVLGSAAFAADETPASVAFSDTCDGIHAVFTSADQHVTEFDVTTPAGDLDTVTGTGTRDYAADASAPDLSVSYDGTDAAWSWTEPADCAPAGSAEPTVDASKDCVTGITLVLGNLNGTADATFTVTAVDGSTETHAVRAGSLEKVSYPVTEDTTGVVTVEADGGLSKTVTYEKDCTTVKGVKHYHGEGNGNGTGNSTGNGTGSDTGTGSTQPETGTDTEAAPTLPMTGYDGGSAALAGLFLVAVGAVLVRAGSLRRSAR